MNGAKNFSSIITLFVFLLILSQLHPNKVFAVTYREKDKKCMEECHSKDIKYNPYGYFGNLNSINVDYELFLKSKHSAFNCVDCHFDVEAGEKAHFLYFHLFVLYVEMETGELFLLKLVTL